jgi:hypothetical protein
MDPIDILKLLVEFASDSKNMYAVVIALTILGFFVQFAILSVYLYFRDSMYKSALRDWVKENEIQIRDQFFGDNFATQVLNQKLKQWDVKINVIFVLLTILFALLYGNQHTTDKTLLYLFLQRTPTHLEGINLSSAYIKSECSQGDNRFSQ